MLDALKDVDDAYNSLQDSPTGIKTRSQGASKRRLEKFEREAMKQKTLLSKINRVLELLNKDHKNFSDLVNGERHYLVAEERLQECLLKMKEIKSEGQAPARHEAFNHKGTVTFENIMLEVKKSYFDRTDDCTNLLAYSDKRLIFIICSSKQVSGLSHKIRRQSCGN